MKENNIIDKYNYIVFKDRIGELFVIRDIQLKDCMFAGNLRDLKILERGTWERPESEKDNTSFYIEKLINKRKQFLSKMGKYQIPKWVKKYIAKDVKTVW